MNTIKHTQTIWISNEVPNLQNNLDEVTWCKTINDAKHTIQEYEIETINSTFVKDAKVFIRPIDKIVVEDSDIYEEINHWFKESNRQYLFDKVEMIPKELSLGNIDSEMIRYVLTRIEHGKLYYFSKKDNDMYAHYWSANINDAIIYNTYADAEDQLNKHYIENSCEGVIRKIKINGKINYIY